MLLRTKRCREDFLVKRQSAILTVLIILIFPALLQAAPFSIVGPRALGMGGASVAAVNDSTAAYWNPASLADNRRVDIRIPVEAGVKDHMGIKDTWTNINDIFPLVQAGDPAAITQMQSILTQLDKPKTGADIDGSTGLFVSIPVSKSAIAFSAMGLGYAGVYPTIDSLHTSATVTDPNFVAFNASTATGIGIALREPVVSVATSFAEKLFIGINAKMIYADTYVSSQSLTSTTFNSFKDDVKKNKTSTSKASLDAGILFVPVESVRIGVVGRDLNKPSFPVEGVFPQKQATGDVTLVTRTDEVTLSPQYRAGLAWRPSKTFTLSADYDLRKNDTLTPGYESQIAAVGLEKTFLSESVIVRAGANKNTADSSSKAIYTAGFGFRIYAFRLDLAAGYDFKERQGEASVDIALRF